MILERRLMISGLAAPALVHISSTMPIRILASRILPPRLAPAVVASSSLMALSPVKPPMRYVVRMRHVQGGMTTVIGESPIQRWHDLPAIMQDMTGQLPWWDQALAVGGSVEVHILRDRESPLFG